VSVQALLSAAFAMYKRHFAALVLSSLLLFGVCFVCMLVFMLVFTGVFAALLFTSIALALVVLVIVWVVSSFIGDVVGITFAGGQYRMLILAEREQRVARVSDLWSALRYIPSFLAWAVVIDVLALGCFLVVLLGGWMGLQAGSNVVTYIVLVAAVLVLYWLTVRWVWVVPSIGDSGVSLAAAMRKSSLIVKQVGWWRTFGLLLVVIAINLVVYLVIDVVFSVVVNVLGSSGLVTALIALAPLIVFLGPFETCFLTCMYRFSQVQAGLPDTFDPDPVATAGGTGLAVRQAVAQVSEAVHQLKGTQVSGDPARSTSSGAGAVVPAEAPVAGTVTSPAASPYAAFCGKCGTPRNGQARFCGRCGVSLERAPRA
jgi:hypothetical protein